MFELRPKNTARKNFDTLPRVCFFWNMQIINSSLDQSGKQKYFEEIKELFLDTFTDSENKEEGKLIGSLVEDLMTTTPDEDLLVFVAQDEERTIGSVLFSRFSFESDDTKAFILSPAAVHHEYQKQGIGQQLISHAHENLKSKGVELVVTYGDINFYSKVGYQQISEDMIKAPLTLSYPEGWLAQSLDDASIPKIAGKTHCVQALHDQVYW
jgi:predicted N-acetyltransferase YhbS